MNDFNVIKDASKLRRLISENPDLPIVVLAGEEANTGDYAWMYCSSVCCDIECILDTITPYDDEHIFSDKDDFRGVVSDALWNEKTKDLPDEEYEAMVEAEVAKFEPYWRKVIAIYATN